MTAYEPQVGHRVRMTRVVEGVVTSFSQHAVSINGTAWVTGYDAEVAFERLPDPEPEWQPGDVVMDADGNVFLRTNTVPVWRHGTRYTDDDLLHRPLRRLVPEDPA